MRKRFLSHAIVTLVAIATLAGSAGCDQTLGDYIVIPGFPGFELSNVRVMNASSDIGEVDVWNRAYPFFQNLDNGAVSEYTHINDGVRTFAVVDTDATTDSNPIMQSDLKYPVDTWQTVLIVGVTGAYDMIRFDDDRTPPIGDGIRFRLVNALPAGPSIQAFGAADEILAPAIAYRGATGSVEFAANFGDISIRRTDTDETLFSGATIADAVSDRHTYTIVIYPNASNEISIRILENNLAVEF
ncbi:MAG TPA: DUF4397 domain-containing protein [Phycisphaerae bacterium]|nr:DUF4397 domain-containing protein [Phycisphaerae bacterium]HRW51477.1 DUF4397 domain-containing protein [Phycisphaerae bacterium]